MGPSGPTGAALASLFTAGDPEPVRRVGAMRLAMRAAQLEGVEPDPELARMYRLLALAKSHGRFVVPEALRA